MLTFFQANASHTLQDFSSHHTTESTESSNVIRFQPQSDFRSRWRDRCLNENAIDPEVYRANIQFLEGQALYEALGWSVPRQAGFRSQPWNEAAVFVGEDGIAWQARLDVPRVSKDGKVGKYDSPKNGGARIFFPNVPVKIRKKITERYGVDVPLTGSFWAWFNSYEEAKKIPIFPTEGGTKCLSLISQGFVSISLYGCSSAWEKRDSKYDKRVLLPQLRETVRGRTVLFAFDSDVKPQAQATVRASIALIGKAIKVLTPSVKVMTWNPEQGKGIDDFIATQGSDALSALIDSAIDFPEWKKLGTKLWAQTTYSLYGGQAKADLNALAPTITDCGFRLPALGEAFLVSGAMGLGKTHWFGVVIPELKKLYPDLIVDAIGHRNNLLIQTGKRLRLTHIRDTASGQYTGACIENEDTLAYCIDSLWRRYDTLIRAMASGRKVLLILDELDAVMKHLLLSSTIKPERRIDLLRKLGVLLQQIAAGNGWIIGGEAGLTALSVDALRDVSLGRLKITVAENEMLPAPWRCVQVEGYRLKGSETKSATPKQTALALTLKLLLEGKRVALLTTSQEAAEQFDSAFTQNSVNVRRFDSKTSSEEENRGVFENLGKAIEESDVQVFIATPTIESGVSIEGEGIVDAIVLYASGLEPSTSYQMLGRFRDPNIPRYLCVAERGHGIGSFDSGEVLQKWRDCVLGSMDTHGLRGEVDPILTVAHELAAKYSARESAGVGNLREFLIEKLRADGHSIVEESLEVPEIVADALKMAKQAVENQRCADWSSADDSGLTPESARIEMRSSDLNWENRVKCLKAIARGKYGGLVDQESWVKAFWSNERDGKSLENAIKTAADFSTEGMAAESDRRALSRQIRATGTIWGADFRGRDRVIQTLQKLNLQCILPYVGSGVPIHADHSSVRSVFKSALLIADEVSDVLGLTISPETRPMAFVVDLLRGRLGYEFEVDQVTVSKLSPDLIAHEKPLDISIEDFGVQLNNSPETETPEATLTPTKRGRGRPKKSEQIQGETQRIRVYRIKPCPHHAEMMEAIVDQHQASPEPEPTTPESQIQPGRSINWGGELWTVVVVRGGDVLLCEGGTVQPIGRCLKTRIEHVLSAA